MKRLLLITLLMVLSGCATVGNLAIQDKEKVSQIKEGVSTKAQVQELIGSPTLVGFSSDGLETWTYLVSHASINPASMIPVVGLFANNQNIENTSLVVMFTNDGVVKKMAYTAPPISSNETTPTNNMMP